MPDDGGNDDKGVGVWQDLRCTYSAATVTRTRKSSKVSSSAKNLWIKGSENLGTNPGFSQQQGWIAKAQVIVVRD